MKTSSSKPSYMLRQSEFRATLDGTGVVNLTKLSDLVLARLQVIEAARAGSGRRTAHSKGRLLAATRRFLTERGEFSFATGDAAYIISSIVDLHKLWLNSEDAS